MLLLDPTDYFSIPCGLEGTSLFLHYMSLLTTINNITVFFRHCVLWAVYSFYCLMVVHCFTHKTHRRSWEVFYLSFVCIWRCELLSTLWPKDLTHLCLLVTLGMCLKPMWDTLLNFFAFGMQWKAEHASEQAGSLVKLNKGCECQKGW